MYAALERADSHATDTVRKHRGAGAGDAAGNVAVLTGFLDLLEDDVAQNEELIVFATEGFARYLEELTAGIEVDYDAPIEGDFQL